MKLNESSQNFAIHSAKPFQPLKEFILEMNNLAINPRTPVLCYHKCPWVHCDPTFKDINWLFCTLTLNISKSYSTLKSASSDTLNYKYTRF